MNFIILHVHKLKFLSKLHAWLTFPLVHRNASSHEKGKYIVRILSNEIARAPKVSQERWKNG